jgi:glycosyltransferase involved in cell wall biosynthesis
VAAVANLYPTKGLDHLIVAMAEVRRMEPSARLLIIGEGPERPRLEALTRAHRLEDGITLAGKMPDPWNLLPGAKVFVLSSVKEGLPFVLLEAMAAGIPIVASRVGGIPEIVTDEHSALLVPPGDPPALARAICRLLQDGELGAALARAAQATLRRDELTADAMVAATADLYRRLLAARRVR